MTTPDIGYLSDLTIDPEYATPSDHDIITFDFENLINQVGQAQTCSKITGWALKETTKEQESTAKEEWKIKANNRPVMNKNNSINVLDLEAQWKTDPLMETLDHNFKQLRVCSRSKRW